ncbi:Nn.00g036880.m01.CDS01 [Neocucurbitaria sp. VM-36]
MRLSAPRIPLPRGVAKPPNARSSDCPCQRQFSYKHPRQFLVAYQGTARPQLPFLYPSNQHLSNGQLLRLFSISANHKKFIKETAKLSVRYSILIFLLTSCFSIASLGILSEQQERAFPSPHEWSLITRFRFRRGKWWQVPENNEEEGFPNWARVYSELQYALSRLENPDKDGAGLMEQEEGGILVPGVGKTGFDLTAKSEEWRQGYYEVLMGMASAAERLDGWVTDKWRRNVWAPEFVESASNPRPKAVLPGMPELPDEEHRVAAAEAPETFYLKIITSKGFTTYQRLSAALGYADWLNFRKLPDSAEEMYRWALDIAIAGLPTPDPSTVISRETGILSSTATKESVTPNIVYAATNLATFMAGNGKVASALPIFVSLLRARLNADEAHIPTVLHLKDSSLTGTLVSLLKEPDYPPVPPTGDEPLLRKETDRCEEAALKNYIGEILFATAGTSSSKRQQGLSWVRDGVSTSKLAQSLDPIKSNESLRKKCEQCEEVGLESWGKIMTYLAADAREKRDAANSSWLTSLLWKVKGTKVSDEDIEILEGESEGVMLRLNKLRSRMLKEEYDDMDRKYARTFVF